jgi:hypothetical protein
VNRKCEIEDELPHSDDGKSLFSDEVSPPSIGKLFSDISFLTSAPLSIYVVSTEEIFCQ